MEDEWTPFRVCESVLNNVAVACEEKLVILNVCDFSLHECWFVGRANVWSRLRNQWEHQEPTTQLNPEKNNHQQLKTNIK